MKNICFNKDLVVVDQPLRTKEEVILALADRLARQGCVHPTYHQAVLTREANFPTGLPTEPVGVAIPHADPEHCRVPAMAVARLASPVTFGLMGDESAVVDVSVVFLLALPAEKQVEFLSQLAALFQTPAELEQLLQLTAPEAIVDFIQAKVNLRLA